MYARYLTDSCKSNSLWGLSGEAVCSNVGRKTELLEVWRSDPKNFRPEEGINVYDGNVPHLRRSEFLGQYPALPGWATSRRASGARVGQGLLPVRLMCADTAVMIRGTLSVSVYEYR